MLSRAADSIYWMNRYIERAENSARIVDVVRHLLLDLPDQGNNQWESLVQTTDDEADFRERYGKATESNVIHFLTLDRDNPNSIASSLWLARENARSVRDAISSEMWEQINMTYLMVQEADEKNRVVDDPSGFFRHFKKACHLFVGTTDLTMTHGEGWHFGRMGRLIERAEKTSRILDVKYYMLLPEVDYVGTPYDNLHRAALLKSTSAFEMYQKQHRRVTPAHVVKFLMLDPRFPRAMRFCLIKAEESLHAITGSPAATFGNPAEQHIGRLRAEMDYADVNEILDSGLHEYLDGFQEKLNAFGDAVYHTFFDRSTLPE